MQVARNFGLIFWYFGQIYPRQSEILHIGTGHIKAWIFAEQQNSRMRRTRPFRVIQTERRQLLLYGTVICLDRFRIHRFAAIGIKLTERQFVNRCLITGAGIKRARLCNPAFAENPLLLFVGNSLTRAYANMDTPLVADGWKVRWKNLYYRNLALLK